MMFLAILIQAASAASPSATPDTRPVIWNQLRTGMTKAEVKAVYPKSLVPVAEGCHVVYKPIFNSKGLHRVDLEWSVKDAAEKRCGTMIAATLVKKYGEPDTTNSETERGDCGNEYAGGFAGTAAQLCKSMGGENPHHYAFSRWTREGIEITFKVESDKDDPKWWAVYRPAMIEDTKAAASF